MEHNQLSAYLRQDPFPLFVHQKNSESSEFAELVTKVLTPKVHTDGSFIDSLHGETAGHPFLTVNLLVTVVDWLIEHGRTLKDLRLTGSVFAGFTGEKLVPKQIPLNPEFEFFRNAARNALSPAARAQDPWLFAMYATLHKIAQESPTSLSCSRADFARLMQELLGDSPEYSPDEILRTGSQANFLAFTESVVRPAIPVLARIAGTITVPLPTTAHGGGHAQPR